MTPRLLVSRSKLKKHRRKMVEKIQNNFNESQRKFSESEIPLFKNLVTLESNFLPHHYPYMDSASWLYLDPNPLIQIEAPVMHSHNVDYALPTPRRKTISCNHHHHHHHHNHHNDHYNNDKNRQQYCRHRRVVSDPGWNNRNILNSTNLNKQHRRVSSYHQQQNDIFLKETIKERNNDDSLTSTFRKVPWHSNLHMLKIRRT